MLFAGPLGSILSSSSLSCSRCRHCYVCVSYCRYTAGHVRTTALPLFILPFLNMAVRKEKQEGHIQFCISGQDVLCHLDLDEHVTK